MRCTWCDLGGGEMVVGGLKGPKRRGAHIGSNPS